MLTKVIITAASGYGGCGSVEARSRSRVCVHVGRRLLLAVIQRGLITMVAVGNDQLLVAHRADHQSKRVRIGDTGDAMQHAVLVRDLDLRLKVLEQNLFELCAGSE